MENVQQRSKKMATKEHFEKNGTAYIISLIIGGLVTLVPLIRGDQTQPTDAGLTPKQKTEVKEIVVEKNEIIIEKINNLTVGVNDLKGEVKEMRIQLSGNLKEYRRREDK